MINSQHLSFLFSEEFLLPQHCQISLHFTTFAFRSPSSSSWVFSTGWDLGNGVISFVLRTLSYGLSISIISFISVVFLPPSTSAWSRTASRPTTVPCISSQIVSPFPVSFAFAFTSSGTVRLHRCSCSSRLDISDYSPYQIMKLLVCTFALRNHKVADLEPNKYLKINLSAHKCTSPDPDYWVNDQRWKE